VERRALARRMLQRRRAEARRCEVIGVRRTEGVSRLSRARARVALAHSAAGPAPGRVSFWLELGRSPHAVPINAIYD
jgi:hypothetical protein